MFPATIIVAPNSLKARTNPNNVPAITPWYDNGSVIEKKVFIGPAPNDLADLSSRGSTADIATMIERTIKGKDTTAAANEAATQVNMISIPKTVCIKVPMGLRLPSAIKRA